MFYLETERLYLVETPRAVMEQRLREDDFEAEVPVPGGTRRVRFPPQWPGDALHIFPLHLRDMDTNPSHEPLGGTIVERETGEAVGQMSFRRPGSELGTIELGYGMDPSRWGRGYATEMARAMVEWARQQTWVNRIVSACLVENRASVRVLEKAGFRRTGEADSDEGRLITWEY